MRGAMKKKPKNDEEPSLPFPLREQLRRRSIAQHVGVPAMPDGETENRRAAVPPRGGVAP